MEMPRTVLLAFVVVLTTTVAGCRTSPRKDLVEAELRVKDQDLRELKGELQKSEAYNHYLQRELGVIQGMSGPPTVHTAGVSSSRVRSITLGRQTSGIDDDGLPGDEALQVVIEPRDGDGHVVKALGRVTIEAYEVTIEGLKKPLCNWQADPEMLRKSWRTGLLSTGYSLALSWRNWPTNPKLRVIVQFVAEDGRVFEADRDVTIRLAPDALRIRPTVEEPLLPAPREGDILPVPRKIEPEKKDETTGPPVVIPTSATKEEGRPLQGAVELLKPVFVDE
jgi:hypothetical protein